MTENTIPNRFRIKWSRSVKGVVTPECTVEGEDYDEVWAKHRTLVQALEREYPASTGG